MDKLLQYEGGQKSKSYPKATFLGIGTRVYNYQKKLAEKSGSKDPKNEKLQDLPAETARATGEAETGISCYFTRKRKHDYH